MDRMLAPEHKKRFEDLLQPDVYEAAWRFASRLSATREDAEDLLQDGLVAAVKRIASLRDDNSFKSWLMSIIRRRYIDHWRRAKAHRQPEDEAYELTAPDTGDKLPLEIADAMNRLPEPQREMLVLFYIEGLSLKETGQVMGISARAVRQRLFRARNALRAHLPSLSRRDKPMQQINSGVRE